MVASNMRLGILFMLYGRLLEMDDGPQKIETCAKPSSASINGLKCIGVAAASPSNKSVHIRVRTTLSSKLPSVSCTLRRCQHNPAIAEWTMKDERLDCRQDS